MASVIHFIYKRYGSVFKASSSSEFGVLLMLGTYMHAYLLRLKNSILRVLRKHVTDKFWEMGKMLEAL